MRSGLAIALAVAACGTSTPPIPTEPATVTLHGFTVAGDFPVGWKIEDPHGAQHSWLFDDRATHRTLARLDVEPLPCIGMPCSGDGFRDEIARQHAAVDERSPDTRTELPFEEVHRGIYRSADRRCARVRRLRARPAGGALAPAARPLPRARRHLGARGLTDSTTMRA